METSTTVSSGSYFSNIPEGIMDQPLIEDTCLSTTGATFPKTQKSPYDETQGAPGTLSNKYHLEGVGASSYDRSEMTEGLSDFLTCTTGSRSEDYNAAYKKPEEDSIEIRSLKYVPSVPGPNVQQDTSNEMKDSSAELPAKVPPVVPVKGLSVPESCQRCQLRYQATKVKSGLDQATPFVAVRNPNCKFEKSHCISNFLHCIFVQ